MFGSRTRKVIGNHECGSLNGDISAGDVAAFEALGLGKY